ncbi:MAG: glycoside hydrolase family 97 catalytic domain-containing protein [Kiritimatiellae bacterium]|nr:glycoside hydrolase family 97 catalytic domain-containing protein [Kiritimatiellia bacterium]
MRNTTKTAIAYFLVSTAAFGAVAPSAKFEDGMLSKTRPAGWLAEVCRLQAEGLGGHPEALSYPYDTCLWAGEIPRMGRHGQDWWRYEQTAYYTDGLIRLGYATGNESFIEKGVAGIEYTLANAAPDGHLGHPSLWDAASYKLKDGFDMWPLAVFFRVMKAKYDASPDERIPAALRRNFLNYDSKHVSRLRNIVNVEGLLWTYAHTGDKRLLDLAEEAWNLRRPLPPEKKNELAPQNCSNDDAIHMHGVTYCEEMKVPMLLAAYTGKREYFEQAVNVERKLVRDHMLPDGCPTSAERTLGNNVHVCHETCDVVDYTWSLGYFLETTGDAAYADRIERCVFNAGFGAIGDDFRSLQYFSNVNQFIATSNSDHNPQNYGTTWMQYRPTHETECCAGNVSRIVPNFIARMWMKDKEGRPVAALYGPSEIDFGWAKIKEETKYPFDGKIVFRFSVKEPTESAFTYRVPGWCRSGASVKVNGKSVAAAKPGVFATIERKFADGDMIELDFPMDVRFEELARRHVVDNKDVKRGVKRAAGKFSNASQGTVVSRGPLLFAYPIPTERTEDAEEHANMNGKKSANPEFKSWNLRPAGPFNYALAAHSAEVVGSGEKGTGAGDGFFRNPSDVRIRVSVKRIEWNLDEDRFTPDLPERPAIIGDGVETIELVPYGATMLRLGAFPDVSKPRVASLYMAGDSIMADYKAEEFPQMGWGQVLKSFMKDSAALHNLARSGWSARRFRESGRWENCIASKLKPGDWVIVSFGHNDKNKKRNKPPKNDYSTIDEYKAFLKGFAADVKAKDANIAFATSIAHSSGFSEKNGVMSVDGGATGLGQYVAAMREVAAELNAPLLDLNRYAEENLPKLGLEKAKGLYMTIKPGEYANYPDGKRDAAHVRDAGAFFYARGAVEMARSQGVPLTDLFKDPSGVPFVPPVAPVASAADACGRRFSSVSPDGLNELRLEIGEKGMKYSVWRRGKAIVEPTGLSLAVEGRGALNGAGAEPKATTRKVDGTLATPLYKKSAIDLAANETKVDFGEWAVRLHARNDGVAWRFETKFEGEIEVSAESTTVRFPKGAELCYTVEAGFMSGWEKPAQIGPVESVPAGHPQIVMTPFTATVPGAGVVTATESDLRDYPGLNFYRKDGEPDTLHSWQAGVPREVEKARRKIKVASRESYLAKTGGTRAFPWRVFVLGDTPSDLVASDAVYALAAPNSSTPNFSWVKPGQVAWDWWNGFKITDVPGLKTGCNFETYKEYVNFAAANGIEYIIMDEGWSEKLNLEKPRDEVNVPGVIAYAKEKGVGVILWAAWSPLYDRATRIRVFDRYAAMGAKGFKIDFIERDDQDVERFLEETAADAAERKLVVMYHGIHKPTGLQRMYPNILNYEGVYGLEQGGRSGGRKVVVSNDVNLVYTRMVAGFMDYTPGAMRNRAFDAPPFVAERDTRACYGTRCHQLALFPMFEAPIQMLCDSPTQYRTEPECTAFLTKVPTVWDETRGVAGEIGKFASVARRKGGEWWLGAITNWEARELELPTDFLGEGEWKVEAFEDASDADKNAEHYVRREFTLKSGEPLKVRLASGGGFAARIVPMASGK